MTRSLILALLLIVSGAALAGCSMGCINPFTNLSDCPKIAL